MSSEYKMSLLKKDYETLINSLQMTLAYEFVGGEVEQSTIHLMKSVLDDVQKMLNDIESVSYRDVNNMHHCISAVSYMSKILILNYQSQK